MDDSTLTVRAIAGIGEIDGGADLVTVIADALLASGRPADGDIIAVASKIVSKAEGRRIAAHDREQAITDETVRVVARREHPGGVTRIVQNRNGFVMAAAGVDASNTPDGTVLLLPIDPDASARALRAGLQERLAVRLAVVITDTFGRPWRTGQTDVAIGAAGLVVVDDLAGTLDAHGRELRVTQTAVADEVAGAAELVIGKTSQCPVAVISGLARHVTDHDGPGARALVRAPEHDLFRLGSDEAWHAGYEAGVAAATRA